MSRVTVQHHRTNPQQGVHAARPQRLLKEEQTEKQAARWSGHRLKTLTQR